MKSYQTLKELSSDFDVDSDTKNINLWMPKFESSLREDFMEIFKEAAFELNYNYNGDFYVEDELSQGATYFYAEPKYSDENFKMELLIKYLLYHNRIIVSV